MKNTMILNNGGTFSSKVSELCLAPSISGDEILAELGMIS